MKPTIKFTQPLLIAIAATLGLAPIANANEEAYEVTAKAWSSYNGGLWDETISHCDRVIQIWGAQAKQINKSLQSPPEDAENYANLNEVGTCLWMKGEAQLKQGDRKGALETFKALVNNYEHAQCWDQNGWYWKVSNAAMERINELE